jgi:hypothetical protein
MSKATLKPNYYSGAILRPQSSTKHRMALLSYLGLFLVVFGTQLAFGMWMNLRGFVWWDASARAAGSLSVLYSTDPHLAAIGFVWMPLPSLIELAWVAFYPYWPTMVVNGFASTLTTALAGGASAAILLVTARRLGLSSTLGWLYALIVSANPMLFLYATNGMSEGVAAPFLIGSVCCIVLFWSTGQRYYVPVAGLALALGFASLYEAVPFGAALFAALVLQILFGGQKMSKAAPQGKLRAVEGLGVTFLVPSFYVAALWVGANAVIMDDPLYFATSEYSNAGLTAGIGAGATEVIGDKTAVLKFCMERAVPFLVPVLFLLVARLLDGRLLRINTLSLLLLSSSVQFGLIAPLLYEGMSYGWLRFFMYPLFVAAGWGLYEIAQSKHRRLAVTLVLAGWVLAAPVIFQAMKDPRLGQEENHVVEALFTGERFRYGENIIPVVRYLETEVFSKHQTVLLEPEDEWDVAMRISPHDFGEHVIVTRDSKYRHMVENPTQYGVEYFLVPERTPQKDINREYPRLYEGGEPGFVLVKSFPEKEPQLRLYKVVSPKEDDLDKSRSASGQAQSSIVGRKD